MRIYFSDGTFEDFVYDNTCKSTSDDLQADINQFASILRERLGLDAEQLFLELLDEQASELGYYYTEGDGADESMRDLLMETQNGVDDVVRKLQDMLSGRLNAMQLQLICNQLKQVSKEIDNEL